MDLNRALADHPSPDTLEAYALSNVDARASVQIDEHLLVCTRCQGELAEIDQYVATMKAGLLEEAAAQGLVSAPGEAWHAGHFALTGLGGRHPSSQVERSSVPASWSAGWAAGYRGFGSWSWVGMAAGLCIVLFASIGSVNKLVLSPELSMEASMETSRQPAAVILSSMRGSGDALFANAPALQPLCLSIASVDLAAGGSFRLEIVDATGEAAFEVAIRPGIPPPLQLDEPSDRRAPRAALETARAQPILVRVDPPLTAGIYWVRLYDTEQRLLREYGLRVE